MPKRDKTGREIRRATERARLGAGKLGPPRNGHGSGNGSTPPEDPPAPALPWPTGPVERIIVGGSIGFGLLDPEDVPGLTARAGFIRAVETNGAVSVYLMSVGTWIDLVGRAYALAQKENERIQNENTHSSDPIGGSGENADPAADRDAGSGPSVG